MNVQDTITPAKAGATTLRNLIDAMDLLSEVRDLNEAMHMACGSLPDRQHRAALQRQSALCSDLLRNVTDCLESVQAAALEGGAA